MTAPHEGGGEPLAQDGLGDLADAITESFGAFEGFKTQLTKAAGTTQGSGWGVMAYEPLSGRLIVEHGLRKLLPEHSPGLTDRWTDSSTGCLCRSTVLFGNALGHEIRGCPSWTV